MVFLKDELDINIVDRGGTERLAPQLEETVDTVSVFPKVGLAGVVVGVDRGGLQ
eukprot:CAMPEP_0114526498 /NCGR_PEP_ID=MMETSP0109-20121206/23055_1 /TAXON_ID=29199 /ORGANISM="Chlorarachnion reptans, Strain CCCM449" /LENGTH=53 /DNA_ID=CAMNT_0001708281 /DNA_START=912 /DNA_END=1073 /DNA_ORIENTATION=-